MIIGTNSSYHVPQRFLVQFRFRDQVGQSKIKSFSAINHVNVLAHLLDQIVHVSISSKHTNYLKHITGWYETEWFIAFV